MDTLAPEGWAVNVTSLTRLGDDRAVAHVDVGLFHIGSLWIVDLASRPKVSWPRTSRGYSIINVDQPLRGEIERAVLQKLKPLLTVLDAG